MVNDEVNNKAINIEIKVAEYSAKAIFKAIKKIMEDAAEKSQPLADYLSEKRKTNSRRLKDMVKKGQTVAIIEAMKLENEIQSAFDGQVSAVNIKKGDDVKNKDELIVLK